MWLSQSSLEALEMLAVKPRETWRITLHEWISGASAAALVRRGLAKYVYDHPDRMWDFSRKVHITDAGRDFLAERNGVGS